MEFSAWRKDDQRTVPDFCDVSVPNLPMTRPRTYKKWSREETESKNRKLKIESWNKSLNKIQNWPQSDTGLGPLFDYSCTRRRYKANICIKPNYYSSKKKHCSITVAEPKHDYQMWQKSGKTKLSRTGTDKRKVATK